MNHLIESEWQAQGTEVHPETLKVQCACASKILRFVTDSRTTKVWPNLGPIGAPRGVLDANDSYSVSVLGNVFDEFVMRKLRTNLAPHFVDSSGITLSLYSVTLREIGNDVMKAY